MFTTPIRIGPLIAKNVRAAAIATALGVHLSVGLPANPAGDVLAALVVVLPALEITMFALMFAIVRDDLGGARAPGRKLAAFALWLVLGYASMRIYGAFTVAGIDAYTKLGLPPILDLAL